MIRWCSRVRPIGERIGLVLLLLPGGCGEARETAKDGTATHETGDTGTIVIKMTDFVVPAGGESYKCQNFSNPFGTTAVDIDTFESHMPVGAHHMIVFFVDGVTDGPLEDCSGSEFHGNVFGAQTPDSVIDLPPGIGVAVPATMGLRFQLHYVNTSQDDATAGVTTKFHVAEPGSVTDHAGQLIFSNESITIPPAVPTQVTKTCAATTPISLLGASAHMHRHAVDFTATSNGNLIYQTPGQTDPVPTRFDPPLLLPANQGVTFTCSYMNDTSRTISFGESALTDEMCIFAAIYYPVADVTFPNIPCF